MYSRISKHHSHQTLLEELGAHCRAHVAQRELGKGIVRVLLVQRIQQVLHLVGGHGLGAGHRDLQRLLPGGNVLAGLQGQVLAAQCGGSRLLNSREVKAVLVAQGDHCTARELGVQPDAQHHGAEDDGCHQAGGNGQEALAQGDKVDGLLLCRCVFVCTIQPRVAQRLDGRGATDHHPGSEHAKHKVEQNAREQRVAKCVDGASRRGAKGKEHKVQCLGKQTIRGAKGTHQHDGDDDDGQ